MEKKILIVDDEDDLLDLVSLILRDAGYEVDTARNGEAALNKLRKEPFDLVLLDIMMPGMDGWEVLKVLKLDSRTSDIPVAMLTCKADAKDKLFGLQEGAVDYVTKPFSSEELISRVEGIFSHMGSQRKDHGG